MTIPALRAAGIYVERIRRPLSRGMKYRLWRAPDETVAIVYGRDQLNAAAAALLAGKPLPPPAMLTPSGRISAIVRPRCRYL